METRCHASVRQLALAFALPLFVLLSGCTSGVGTQGSRGVAPPAPLQTIQPIDRLVAAMEDRNCILTPENRDEVLVNANIRLHELEPIVRELANQERIEVAADSTLRVLTDNCI
jgi:hypothetical protein